MSDIAGIGNTHPGPHSQAIHPKLKEIVAAVAREQGGNVVDLVQIESDVRTAIFQRAIEEIWEYFGADLIPAELAEQALQTFERKLLEEIIRQPIFTSEQHARLAVHRTARGVRNVRGAK